MENTVQTRLQQALHNMDIYTQSLHRIQEILFELRNSSLNMRELIEEYKA